MKSPPPFFPYDCRGAGYSFPPKPDNLCGKCWDGPFGAHAAWLFDVSDRSQEKRTYSYLASADEVKFHADSGCAGCSLVSPELLPSSNPVNIDIEVGLCFDEGAPLTGMHMITFRLNNSQWGRRYAYTLDHDHPAAPHTKAHEPVIDVGSAGAFQLARDIIQNCEKGHDRCRDLTIPADETTLPKRLVDCTDLDRPRLVHTGGQRGQYVALSYVWGGDQPHKTTRLNLCQYESGLDLTLLPQTIRDAMRVTHELGFKLLWIDSLCIVQDADDEKQLEIGNMHRIFRYAALTIVAASASSAKEGFLNVRQPWKPRIGSYVQLPILWIPAHPTITLKLGTLTLYDTFELSYGWQYRHHPINKRAWCLQEQLMSPRSLLFISTLQYRCQTATHSIGTSFYDWTSETRLPDALFYQTPSPPKHGTRDWYELRIVWVMIVQEYTRRFTTEPSDKLVACAAIAEAFHRSLNSDYLAGLWRRSLLTDLLWHVGGTRTRPAGFRAPSWSWASVDGEVQMTPYPRTAVAEVLWCGVSLKEDSLPFGQVSGGSLVLRARLLRLQLSESTSCMMELRCHPRDQLLKSRRSGHEDDAAVHSYLWYNMSWSVFYDVKSAGDSCDSSWAIPLSCNLQHQLFGLIVAPVKTTDGGSHLAASKTLYRRIGCFRNLRCIHSFEQDQLLARLFEVKTRPFQEIEIV